MPEIETVTVEEYCPFLMCNEPVPHKHPICPECGTVRYGNFSCTTCREVRATDLNPVVRDG